MPRSYAEEFLPMWYNALEEEIGMLYKTDNQAGLCNTLYEARDKAGDPELAELIVYKISTNTVYIAKRSTEVPD